MKLRASFLRWSCLPAFLLTILCASNPVAAGSLQDFLADVRGDCNAVSLRHQSLVQEASQRDTACFQEYVFERRGQSPMKGPCGLASPTFVSCLVEAGNYCRAIERRDREVAACFSRQQARELSRLTEARTRMQGVDEAQGATGVLNDLRARDNRPAHRLSARLTETALDMLDDQTTRTLDEFIKAFDQFERTSPGQNFVETYAKENVFIPGEANAAPPTDIDTLTPEQQQLLKLATEIQDRDYDLPFGNESTLSGAQEERFAEAVRTALDGDPSLLKTGGDPAATAELRLQRRQGAKTEDDRPLFDNRAAQQHLAAAEGAARRLQIEQARTQQEAARAPVAQDGNNTSRQGSAQLTRWPACFERWRRQGWSGRFRNGCGRAVIAYHDYGRGVYTRSGTEMRPGYTWTSPGPMQGRIYCIGPSPEICDRAVTVRVNGGRSARPRM